MRPVSLPLVHSGLRCVYLVLIWVPLALYRVYFGLLRVCSRVPGCVLGIYMSLCDLRSVVSVLIYVIIISPLVVAISIHVMHIQPVTKV